VGEKKAPGLLFDCGFSSVSLLLKL